MEKLLYAEWIGVSLANLMRHQGALRFCQTATGNNTGKSTTYTLHTRTRICMFHIDAYEGRHGQRVEGYRLANTGDVTEDFGSVEWG